MELGHARVFHRSRHPEGKGGAGSEEFRRKAQGTHGPCLLFQNVPLCLGIHDRGHVLKIAGDGAGEFPEPLHSPEICLQIAFCLVRASAADQVGIEDVVLGGKHGGGALGDAHADAVPLRQHAVHPSVPQLPQAQHARHSAADHQHPGAQVPLQGRETGRLHALCP